MLAPFPARPGSPYASGAWAGRGRRRRRPQVLLWGHFLAAVPPPDRPRPPCPAPAADATAPHFMVGEQPPSFPPKPNGGSGWERGEGRGLRTVSRRGWGRGVAPRSGPHPSPSRVGSAVESGGSLSGYHAEACANLVALPLGPVLGVRRRRWTILLEAKGAPTWGAEATGRRSGRRADPFGVSDLGPDPAAAATATAG